MKRSYVKESWWTITAVVVLMALGLLCPQTEGASGRGIFGHPERAGQGRAGGHAHKDPFFHGQAPGHLESFFIPGGDDPVQLGPIVDAGRAAVLIKNLDLSRTLLSVGAESGNDNTTSKRLARAPPPVSLLLKSVIFLKGGGFS
jgi:hypothetical protein